MLLILMLNEFRMCRVLNKFSERTNMNYVPNTLDGAAAAILKETKRSKGELADFLGVTANTLKKKLEGESDLMLSEAVGIAEFLGLTLQEVADLASQASECSNSEVE